MEETKKYFAAKGIDASDITKGIIIHEVLGVSLLVGFWAGCYVMRPSGRKDIFHKINPADSYICPILFQNFLKTFYE